MYFLNFQFKKMVEEIDRLEEEDPSFLPCQSWQITPDPIVIKGIGNLTLFGLNSRFSSEFPCSLKGKLAPEEFQDTMDRINFVLQRNVHSHLRWLICGLIFCCCSMGISLWPVIYLNKGTISAVKETLEQENQLLYNKLGFNWKLSRRPVENAANLTEYVLLIETLAKVPLSVPD
ncbi:hypothetical protein ACQ4LE_010317 [Meloidogyne hapla]